MLRLLISGALGAQAVALSCAMLRGSETDPVVQLVAELTAPADARLRWKNPSPRAAGHIVEFATAADGENVMVAFCPAHLSEFTHERLAPETTYFYRVRTFYGPTSECVTVSLPAEMSDAQYAQAYALPEEYGWAAPQRVKDGKAVASDSIRTGEADAVGAPADFRATLVDTTVSGFLLRWTDCAGDEDGFLLEKVVDDEREFLVCALIEPDMNSFGWAFEPPAREGVFRVRAIYFGRPSNLTRVTTLPGPEEASAPPGPEVGD